MAHIGKELRLRAIGSVDFLASQNKVLTNGLQLFDFKIRSRRFDIFVCQVVELVHNRFQRCAQACAHLLGPLPQEIDEDQVERDQTRDHQPCDCLQLIAQTFGFCKDVAFRRHDQNFPTHPGDISPCAQHPLIQIERQHPVAIFRNGRTEFGCVSAFVDVEIFRLESVRQDRFFIAMLGQFPQFEVLFALRRHRQDCSVAADKDRISVPRKGNVQNMADNGIHGHVDTYHRLQLVTHIRRRNRRHHPARPRRIHIGVGPDRLTLRIMFGIGFVIEIVRRDIHQWRILSYHLEVGINPVIRIPSVEIDLRDQRACVCDGPHQRVNPCSAPDLFALGFANGEKAAVVDRRTAVVARGIEHTLGRVGIS